MAAHKKNKGKGGASEAHTTPCKWYICDTDVNDTYVSGDTDVSDTDVCVLQM